MKTAVTMSALRYWYASLLTSNSDSDEQRQRMNRALATLKDAFHQEHEGADPVKHVQAQLKALPGPDAVVPYLVELWAISPFAPHAIKVKQEARLQALEMIIHATGAPLRGTELQRRWREAEKAYADTSRVALVAKVTGMVLVTGAVAMATAGMSLGPSAAIITATLATLGGGAVATGGYGMVGGVALLMLGSATGSGLLFYKREILQKLGIEGLRVELTKLEVTQSLWWKMGAKSAPTQAQVLEQQQQLMTHLKALLNKEELISEAKSEPVKEWKTMIKLVKVSIERLGKVE